LAQLSPRAVERLGELLDSDDERVRLEAARTILDRHLGRPPIQADISLHRAFGNDHITALLETARRRALEPITLDDDQVEILSTTPSSTTWSSGAIAVKRRLDEISHASQEAGQFGPAVRAEELLGRSIGMWIDRSLQLAGQLNDSHISALLELARKRQAEPIELADDEAANSTTPDD
jgi:hypothetical protein